MPTTTAKPTTPIRVRSLTPKKNLASWRDYFIDLGPREKVNASLEVDQFLYGKK